jgi:hypothetical protein
MGAETKRWRFVEREAMLLSRLGCDLTSGALSEDERAVALEHVVRGATRLRQFAEGRLRATRDPRQAPREEGERAKV